MARKKSAAKKVIGALILGGVAVGTYYTISYLAKPKFIEDENEPAGV